MLDVSELLRSTRRGCNKARESPSGSLQLSLFGAKTGEVSFENKKLTLILWVIQNKNYRKKNLVG
jgi:hypothetical protein